MESVDEEIYRCDEAFALMAAPRSLPRNGWLVGRRSAVSSSSALRASSYRAVQGVSDGVGDTSLEPADQRGVEVSCVCEGLSRYSYDPKIHQTRGIGLGGRPILHKPLCSVIQ